MAYIGVSPSNGIRRVFTYTATANQTSFSGVGAENITLSYKDANYVDVYQNGVKLASGDYTATSGTAIVLGTGATVNDMVVIVVFDVFSAADTVSKADGGQFDGNVTMAGTLGVTGAVTANAGVVVDNITIDGTEIDLSSGNLTIDVAGAILLDADVGNVQIHDAGTEIGRFANSSSDFVIKSAVSDKDMIFKGNDGGSEITALTLDMSDAGKATFNAGADFNSACSIITNDNSTQLTLISTDTDSGVGPILSLSRDNNSAADEDLIGQIHFFAEDDGNNQTKYAEIFCQIADASNGSEDGRLSFNARDGGSNREFMRMQGSTGIVINEEGEADLDFRVESDSNANMLFVDAGEDIVSIAGGGSHTVGSFKNTLQIEGTTGQTSSMSITRNTAGTSPPYLQFGKTRGTSVGSNTIVQSGDTLGIITFCGADGTNRDTNAAMIQVDVGGTPGENDLPGRMKFKTTADNSNTPVERMRIDENGRVTIASDGGSIDFTSNASFEVRGQISPLSKINHTQNADEVAMQFRHDYARGSQTATMIQFLNNNGDERGTIKTSNSATSFNTSSDYRLKENVSYDFDATTRLKQLKPARFNFIADETNTFVDGFLAHEVSSIVPEAIDGDKDATKNEDNIILNADGSVKSQGVTEEEWTAGKLATTDKDGNVVDPIYADDTTWVASKTVPKYQSIDQSKLVPLLVKTIQELEARITALESA